MPRQKQSDKCYKIVPDGRKKPHEMYGAFPRDEDGLRDAERFLDHYQEQNPRVPLRIVEG